MWAEGSNAELEANRNWQAELGDPSVVASVLAEITRDSSVDDHSRGRALQILMLFSKEKAADLVKELLESGDGKKTGQELLAAAVTLTASLQLKELTPALERLLFSDAAPNSLCDTIVGILLELDKNAAERILLKALDDPLLAKSFRRIVWGLAKIGSDAAVRTLVDRFLESSALQDSNYDVRDQCRALAVALRAYAPKEKVQLIAMENLEKASPANLIDRNKMVRLLGTIGYAADGDSILRFGKAMLDSSSSPGEKAQAFEMLSKSNTQDGANLILGTLEGSQDVETLVSALSAVQRSTNSYVDEARLKEALTKLLGSDDSSVSLMAASVASSRPGLLAQDSSLMQRVSELAAGYNASSDPAQALIGKQICLNLTAVAPDPDAALMNFWGGIDNAKSPVAQVAIQRIGERVASSRAMMDFSVGLLANASLDPQSKVMLTGQIAAANYPKAEPHILSELRNASDSRTINSYAALVVMYDRANGASVLDQLAEDSKEKGKKTILRQAARMAAMKQRAEK